MSMYQERYWAFLREIKAYTFYLQGYAEHDDRFDKSVDIFIAFASSTSIAAWAVWQNYPVIWAVIIALSQVVTAIKPFLPYKQRIKALLQLADKYQDISLECEKGWFGVAEGELTEKEIHDLYIKLKEKVNSAEQSCLKNIVLPPRKKNMAKAETETDMYLTSNYL